MKCTLLDVFAGQALNGNGLTIFSDCDHLDSAAMQAWTQEMRQFESLFISQTADGFRARIFTMEEELDFAGHPLLGLAAWLHEQYGPARSDDKQEDEIQRWRVALNQQTVTLFSQRVAGHWLATMQQESPQLLAQLTAAQAQIFYDALNLTAPDNPNLSADVITTGLPYLILPVQGGLEQVQFRVADIGPLLAPFGASFLYVLDVDANEGRTWDNAGKVEDIATGSAAGPAAAWLQAHLGLQDGKVTLKQGRFLNRPSEIRVELVMNGSHIEHLLVRGEVVKVADIALVS
ncbi:PhzF family phenazine biosynthesis protein [Thalassolituus sp. LLYu03]|uniref:PhzF family phenazine biosynthesis protein n=1 Tax=Thalassolituus sp. LLYu03 TaxID=3421656 RepID=UPI003D2E8DBC